MHAEHADSSERNELSGRMRCANFLQAIDLRLCLLLNFGTSRLDIKHVVHSL